MDVLGSMASLHTDVTNAPLAISSGRSAELGRKDQRQQAYAYPANNETNRPQ
jgi:hypothetical protein